MAEDVIPAINQAIDAFTNEKDGAIGATKKITDAASNREHYNDTYENIKYTFEELYDVFHAIEDAELNDEDAQQIVTKLEELIAVENPLFDHFNAYADVSGRILYPWYTPWPERCEQGDDDHVFYKPGYIEDLFKSPHNSAWEISFP